MLDIKFVRENPDIVKQNIKNKFQDEKLPLVDEVIELYGRQLKAKQDAEALQASRNALSKQIGALKGKAKKEPEKAAEYEARGRRDPGSGHRRIRAARAAGEGGRRAGRPASAEIMMKIPNIIDPSVPIGPDDSCNVEVQRFGEADGARLRHALPHRHHGRPSTASTWTSRPPGQPAPASTTCWATSPGSTRPCWPTPGTS